MNESRSKSASPATAGWVFVCMLWCRGFVRGVSDGLFVVFVVSSRRITVLRFAFWG